MSELRTPVGLPFCKPSGQTVLLECVTYVKEGTIMIDKKGSTRGFTYFRIKGYGSFTLECNVDEYPALVNAEDIMYKSFGLATELDKVFEDLTILREALDKSVQRLNEKGITETHNLWKDRLNENRYTRVVQYALTNEQNIAFYTNIDTLEKQFIKYCKKEKLTKEMFANVIDEFITEDLLSKI